MDTIWAPRALSTDRPKYKSLLNALQNDIDMGELNPGDKLPPVRDLAWKLGVTPGTVARAYQEGIKSGVLTAQVGRGTFVSEPAPSQGAEHYMQSTMDDIYPLPVNGQVNLRNTNTTNVGQSAAIRRAMIKVAETKADQYIFYPDQQYVSDIYEPLCDWMKYAGVYTRPDRLIVTNGGQNAVSLAVATILNMETGAIAIDALTYPGIRFAVQAQRGKLVGIETDADGIIPDALARACRKNQIKALFTSANVLNPTTGKMPLERRLQIAEIARKYDVQIVEDDCWGIGANDVPSFSQICPERGWYLSSISKSISSGVRFGYLLCPDAYFDHAKRLMQSYSFGVSRAVVDIVRELFVSGDAAAVRGAVLNLVQKNVQQTVNILGQWGISWRKDVPFIWLSLPSGWRGSSFAAACERENIIVRAADEFALQNMPVPNGVRIAVNSNLPMQTYCDALGVVNELLANPPVSMGS
ncbi:GntR family transcriptional regulator [Amylibacter ulvae]|uniref:GntR family transcriptional regulator n=1 Tax=Paramylibacter ulvae TaxID=1651968 RepID=A0ABQ3CVV6_9RHOB|nr:PLP-dependent aminotransferase family protein [Amylibacter ulvae]GHA46234.1 GntR family transcriptional regulator [Amylibacter ulvae]